jgi:hypothetical protein
VPLFGRRTREQAPAGEFTVGVSDHRVLIAGPVLGLTMLDELRGYVAAVTGGAARPTAEGRDPVAILSAKMDRAELVNDAAVVTALALEELVQRGLLGADEVPPQPQLPPVPQHAQHYDYIQAAHARAEVRMTWLDACDQVLRDHRVGILPPLPKEEAQVRLR